MNSALIYGDISPNVVDGSSIWLASITEVLSNVFESVHLLLKTKPTNDVLISPLLNKNNIHVHWPQTDTELNFQDAKIELEKLAESFQPNLLIARGLDLCNELCKSKTLSAILWSYITDLPFPYTKVSPRNLGRLRRVSSRSRRVLSQTEASRSYLENLIPEAAGKTLLMTPMIPDEAFQMSPRSDSTWPRKLKIIYAGKLAEDWKTFELLDLPAALRKLGVDSELTIIGSKINKSRSNPKWASLMANKLNETASDPDSNVRWLGTLTRSETLEHIADSDLGIGWRTSKLDSSLEISTKALEYSAVGIPSVNNFNKDNLEFFTNDLSILVDSNATVDDLAVAIAGSLPIMHSVDSQLKNKAGYYSMSAAAQRIKSYAQRSGLLSAENPTDGKPQKRIVIASHDFKFMGELIEALSSNPCVDLRLDRWSGLATHDEELSRKLASWADLVFCEWAGPVLAWYSQNLDPSKELVTRLHGFEIRTGNWWPEVAIENIDSMVFVSEHYRNRAISKLGLEKNKTRVIPNCVDTMDLLRPKLPEARFNIGLVGMAPFLKRPDRALDLLERLRDHDPRYTLRIKGRMPWEYPHIWNRSLEKQAYLAFFNRIADSPLLKDSVVFDEFGPEIATWFRNIGFVLSTSDEESFHLAPAEGMASGAIGVIWAREGAEQIFGPENVVHSADEAFDLIVSCENSNVYSAKRNQSILKAAAWDDSQIIRNWNELFGLTKAW